MSDNDVLISIEQLKEIVPLASEKAEIFLGPLNYAMARFEINTPVRRAAFIAQVAYESGSFRYTAEIASGIAYETRSDLGNTGAEAIRIAAEHGSTPGRWWKGHGLILITGYANHKACGEALGLDLLNEPGLICAPYGAARSAAWLWETLGLNNLADKGAFNSITRRINGGYKGKEERLAFYKVAQSVLA